MLPNGCFELLCFHNARCSDVLAACKVQIDIAPNLFVLWSFRDELSTTPCRSEVRGDRFGLRGISAIDEAA
jgi:hypothetical protein